MRKSRSLVELTHTLIKDFLHKDMNCVDMTLGNGNDTLFLAKHCNHVYAYEIQKQGILASKKLLEKNSVNNYTIFYESHENIDKIDGKYEVAVFNLGYLPRSDKSITTNYKSTIIALNKLLNNKTTKLIAIAVYRGHDEGMIESNKLLEYINTLNDDFKINKLESVNISKSSPYLLLFERNK